MSRLGQVVFCLLVLCPVVAACDNDDEPDELSAVVLRDDEITDDPKPFDDSVSEGSTDLYEVLGCAVDDWNLRLDARERDVNYVHRVAPDGDDEGVAVGAWAAPERVRRGALAKVARQVQAAHCIQRPGQRDQAYTGTLTPITGLPGGAVGFRNGSLGWSSDSPSSPYKVGFRRSMIAAYAPVRGYLVSVVLSHFDGTDPEVADLRDLLDKAIDKVRDNG